MEIKNGLEYNDIKLYSWNGELDSEEQTLIISEIEGDYYTQDEAGNVYEKDVKWFNKHGKYPLINVITYNTLEEAENDESIDSSDLIYIKTLSV